MSKYYRKLVLKKFDKYYNIRTGFGSTELWLNKIKDNLWGMIQNIYNDLFDTFAFDFEWHYGNLSKEFRHLSLFSVCLHLLRCQRSCEMTYAGYGSICSGVRDNAFYEYNPFLSVIVSNVVDYLSMICCESVDFDVFLSQPAYFPYAFSKSDRKCSQHQVFSFAHDLFVAFCSVLIRMYLNITMKFFSTLFSNISMVDEQKVISKIFPGVKMLLFRFCDLNYDFFYEFFDLFSEVNYSDCFFMFSNKPKYGPYNGAKYGLEITMF